MTVIDQSKWTCKKQHVIITNMLYQSCVCHRQIFPVKVDLLYLADWPVWSQSNVTDSNPVVMQQHHGDDAYRVLICHN